MCIDPITTLAACGIGGAVHMAAELGLRSLQKDVIDVEISSKRERKETGAEGLVPLPFPIAAVFTPGRSHSFPSWEICT